MSQLIADIASWIWAGPMFFLLVGTHLFLTFRLRFPQRHIFRAIKMSVQSDKDADGDVSQFGALSTALAATIGTGNIIGVATAVMLGGPGAVFWCWLIAIFGIATKYAECLLAVKYRVQTTDGTMLGGPMYAIERGMGKKWMAVLFSLFCVIATFGIGDMVQANAISGALINSYNVNPVTSSIVLTLMLALVLLGGVKFISKVCTVLTPLMALFYVGGCVVLLWQNADYIWPAIQQIVTSAFTTSSVGGGLAGGSVILAMRYGVARGLFSNESGLGSAPIVAAAAQTSNPVRQALVSSTGTFWDTVVICAITGVTLVSTCLHHPEIAAIADGNTLTSVAFGTMGILGDDVLAISVIVFAYSTMLGWSYYGERCAEYLGGKRCIMPFRVVFIAVSVIGCLSQLHLVWNLSDLFNALMAIPNLICLIVLSGVIAAETRTHGYL